ncbi:MAG TPA: HypC/HybG/HupF family hydrogenase formation chaperone [Actinomycetota bacterium]|nr:HypC/HybG/HupF family hydrogenase formation chaperone [Actinomycetota bacterium]
MCLGIPGQVVEVVDPATHIAKVDVGGVRRNVNIGLLLHEGGGVGPGDWVLIHVGFAMSKIDEGEAQSTLGFLEGLGQAYEDELDQLKGSDIT